MRLAASLATLLLAGCSVLVQPTEDRVRCVVGATDPCPSGQRCVDGFCTSIPDGGPACGERELGCNGIDDNCNGMIDEGSDADEDGFTWCDEDPARRDCNDDAPTIYPGAPADPPCDGADNDCSGTAAECASGQFCHPAGGCRVPDCSFVNGICSSAQRCDVTMQPPTCVNLTPDNCTTDAECASAAGTICDPVFRTCMLPRQPGEACTEDGQCDGVQAGARCFETAALGLRSGDVGDAAKVCSRACCTDDDCPSGTACWAPGTGARGCIPVAMIAAGPQGAPADEACGQASDCGGGACALRDSPAYDRATRWALTCGAPVGSTAPGAYCTSPSQCASGLCVRSYCSAACGSNSDCIAEDFCSTVWLSTADVVVGVVQACVYGYFVNGRGEHGDSCLTDLDCRAGDCIEGSCVDVCCTDADCGADVCRPSRDGEHWRMLCQER